MGSDEKVGVWMVVMVDNEEITGALRRGSVHDASATGPGSVIMGSPGSSRGGAGVTSERFTGNKLYAEYLRREGRPGTSESEALHNRESEEARERREVDHQFRDF